MPVVTVIVSRDRTDRNPSAGYRFHLWDQLGDPYASSRASTHSSGAKRDAERLFGPLEWVEPKVLGIEEPWVLQAALVNVQGRTPAIVI